MSWYGITGHSLCVVDTYLQSILWQYLIEGTDSREENNELRKLCSIHRIFSLISICSMEESDQQVLNQHSKSYSDQFIVNKHPAILPYPNNNREGLLWVGSRGGLLLVGCPTKQRTWEGGVTDSSGYKWEYRGTTQDDTCVTHVHSITVCSNTRTPTK